jgi:hypothetical protein
MRPDSLVRICVTLTVEDAESITRQDDGEGIDATLIRVLADRRFDPVEWVAEFLFDVSNAELPKSVTWEALDQ